MTTHIPRTFDVVLNLIVASLAPAFLGVTGGDMALARMAAWDTVNDYQARDNADLLTVGQIVALGLASLSSVTLSMAPDIAPSLLVRLRANAIACTRASEQARRARDKRAAEPPPPDPEPLPTEDESPPKPECMTGQVEQLLAAEAQHRLENPAERRSPTSLPQTDPETIDAKRHQEAWATAIAKEAGSAQATIPTLSPEERPAATIRAGKLSRAFHDLAYKGLLPPHELDAIINRVSPELSGQQPPL